MQYRLSTLLAIITACGISFGFIRAIAHYPSIFLAVVFVAALFAAYLFMSLATVYLITWATSAFNSFIGRVVWRDESTANKVVTSKGAR